MCTGVITMVLVKCCNLKSLFKKLFVQCFVQKVLGGGGEESSGDKNQHL